MRILLRSFKAQPSRFTFDSVFGLNQVSNKAATAVIPKRSNALAQSVRHFRIYDDGRPQVMIASHMGILEIAYRYVVMGSQKFKAFYPDYTIFQEAFWGDRVHRTFYPNFWGQTYLDMPESFQYFLSRSQVFHRNNALDTKLGIHRRLQLWDIIDARQLSQKVLQASHIPFYQASPVVRTNHAGFHFYLHGDYLFTKPLNTQFTVWHNDFKVLQMQGIPLPSSTELYANAKEDAPPLFAVIGAGATTVWLYRDLDNSIMLCIKRASDSFPIDIPTNASVIYDDILTIDMDESLDDPLASIIVGTGNQWDNKFDIRIPEHLDLGIDLPEDRIIRDVPVYAAIGYQRKVLDSVPLANQTTPFDRDMDHPRSWVAPQHITPGSGPDSRFRLHAKSQSEDNYLLPHAYHYEAHKQAFQEVVSFELCDKFFSKLRGKLNKRKTTPSNEVLQVIYTEAFFEAYPNASAEDKFVFQAQAKDWLDKKEAAKPNFLEHTTKGW